jgi:hypothetical protein
VQVSDFLTPAWYHATPQSFAYYSHAGGCRKPRQVAPGGYVSFAAPSGEWWQVFADRNGALSVRDLGQFDRPGSRRCGSSPTSAPGRTVSPDRPKCFACGRNVRPGIKCVSKPVPILKSLNHAGVP